jgi:hypothetical protein
MSKKTDWRTLYREPGVQMYLVLCLAALAVIVFIQVHRKVGVGSQFLNVVLMIVGLLGIIARLRPAPVFLLVLLDLDFVFQLIGGLIESPVPNLEPGWREPLFFASRWSQEGEGLLLCLAFLAYCAGQFRLQSLMNHIIPRDYRRTEEAPPGKDGQTMLRQVRWKRSASLVRIEEVIVLLVGLPVFAVAGQICWYVLQQPTEFFALPSLVSRFLLASWVLVGAVYVISSLLGYWRTTQMSPEQATLMMQDTVWHATRGEQRYLNRWLAWTMIQQKEQEEPQ